MKSSYELAMERMGGDHTQKVLSESQKEKIAEITSKYDAKIAEKKIFLEKNIQEETERGNQDEADKIRSQLVSEITSLEEKADKEKDHIRGT